MRVVPVLVALLIALLSALPGAAVAAGPEPKVVLIVGPAGEATQRYRERAEAAAQVAERYTSNVVRVYSPEATWPAVQQALDGAAVVVYMGHGNGWPSRYRDSLFGGTQNGFGLNPVAGGDDASHQYFGEERIAAEVNLAENAVVLLHHLCYASGNTEPGLPEGTVEDARQRIDNYAAGFIEAGAGAVVAEGHLGPAWYVQQLLDGDRSIDGSWRRSPNARGNETTFASQRSPGFIAAMDPDRADGGFYRSIVYRDGVGAGQLTATPIAPVATEPAEPTLVGSGLNIEMPYFQVRPLAGSAMDLWIPYTVEEAAALKGLTVGVRWDPIDVDGPATEGDGGAPEEAAVPPSEPAPSALAPSEAPAADPSSGRFTFIEPEQVGSVVQPAAAAIGPTRIKTKLAVPERPGRYRLVTTLHDPSGVAFDAPTQALVPAMFVRISGELEARYLVASSASAPSGEDFRLPLAVGNVGSTAWGQVGDAGPRNLDERPISGSIVAHWVRLDAETGDLPGDVHHRLPAGFLPGATERTPLGLTAPDLPGTYLLLIDVVVPGIGSLTARGADPALVRVTVE